MAEATSLAQSLRAHSVPLHSCAEELLVPDAAEALNAQKWIWPGDRSNMGPIRGIDYVIARAACHANISPDSPYGKFLSNVLEACEEDM
eukprot:800788-Heterocapsa_arctica.AAC.1